MRAFIAEVDGLRVILMEGDPDDDAPEGTVRIGVFHETFESLFTEWEHVARQRHGHAAEKETLMGMMVRGMPGTHPRAALHFEPRLDPDTFAIRDYGALGLLLFGQIAVDMFEGFNLMAKARLKGPAVLHMGIAWTMRATFAVTTEKKAPELMKLLGIGPDSKDWLTSCDCGISSLTMYSVLADEPHVLRGTPPDRPFDADDFGRCVRLLERYPAWRGRLGDVVAKHPTWAPVVERWDELARLYAEKNVAEVNRLLERPRP